jgi:hypothetical protein
LLFNKWDKATQNKAVPRVTNLRGSLRHFSK